MVRDIPAPLPFAILVLLGIGLLVWAYFLDRRESRRAQRFARLQDEQQRDYEEASRG